MMNIVIIAVVLRSNSVRLNKRERVWPWERRTKAGKDGSLTGISALIRLIFAELRYLMLILLLLL